MNPMLMSTSEQRLKIRPRHRSLRRGLTATVLAGAFSLLLSAPVIASGPDDADALAASSPCTATALGTAPVNPFNGTSPCATGPTSVQEKYEAGAAGAGALIFGASAYVYRRRRGSQVKQSAPRVRRA